MPDVLCTETGNFKSTKLGYYLFRDLRIAVVSEFKIFKICKRS